MTELEIKKLVANSLLNSSKVKAIGSEVPFLFGRRRADLIGLTDSIATGYEIKSQNDNIGVLASQLEDYRLYFDTVYVVCEPENKVKVRKVIPKWAGLMIADGNKLHFVRKAKFFKTQNKLALLSTLNAKQLKIFGGQEHHTSNFETCKHLALSKQRSEIKSYSRRCLLERYQPSTVIVRRERSSILNSDDIFFLSKAPSSKLRKL